VILGLVYLRLKLDQEGVGDFNGAIFIILANISFTASVGALYVSLSLYITPSLQSIVTIVRCLIGVWF